jgi:hypothetical protein
MTSLKQKVVVWVSVIVMILALMVLPGCTQEEPAQTPPPAAEPNATTK